MKNVTTPPRISRSTLEHLEYWVAGKGPSEIVGCAARDSGDPIATMLTETYQLTDEPVLVVVLEDVIIVDTNPDDDIAHSAVPSPEIVELIRLVDSLPAGKGVTTIEFLDMIDVVRERVIGGPDADR